MPSYPFYGPYGSHDGVVAEANRRSALLEQYVKDVLDGRKPAQIPAELVPDAVRNTTFFVQKRVFAGFSNDHHGDGHVAVVLPASPGLQEALVDEAPHVYYRPPYVGAAGWIGIELDQVSDETLESHIRQAWQLIVNKARKR